jgi:hypothetical protein
MELGRLQRIDAWTVWAHEAYDMTPWLLAARTCSPTSSGSTSS